MERFWSKVKKGKGCWVWMAGKSSGYGSFFFRGKNSYAHRAAWILTNGEIKDGLCVCHHCDNPICVKPSHLFLGTYSDNMQDAVRKGRIANGNRQGMRLHPQSVTRGEKVWNAKLDENKVRVIFKLSPSRSVRSIAMKFKVSEAAIYKILARKNWAHVGVHGA